MCKHYLSQLDELEQKFLEANQEFRYNINYQAFNAFKQVVTGEYFEGEWKDKDTNQVHSIIIESKMKESNLDTPLALEPKEIFRINISLAYMFKCFLKHELIKKEFKVGKWPKVNIYPRPDLALNKNLFPLSELHIFERLLQKMMNEKPNRRTAYEVISAWVIFRLIAVDGIIIGTGDIKIVQLERKHLFLEGDINWLCLPVGVTGQKVFKQYPLTKETVSALKLLIKKSNKIGENSFVFPHNWRTVRNKKKTDRRAFLEQYLADFAWNIDEVSGLDRVFDLKWWIQMSRQNMEFAGVPYYVIANMRNKIRAAQLDFQFKSSRKAFHHDLREHMPSLVYDLYIKLQNVYSAYRKKEKRVQVKKLLHAQLCNVLCDNELPQIIPIKWIQYFEWFISLIIDPHKKDLTISALHTYTYILANRVMVHIKQESLEQLTTSDWDALKLFIQEHPEYGRQTKINTLSQLSNLHNYISSKVGERPLKQVSSGIVREIAHSHIVYRSEFNVLLRMVTEYPSVWIAMFLAFYAGLRCEEIFSLKKTDFDDMERLPIRESKTNAGHRVLPLASLLDASAEKSLRVFLNKIERPTNRIISSISSPKNLSSKVSKIMRAKGVGHCTLHMLRHSFASIQFLKYNMLIDPNFKEYLVKAIPTISEEVLQGHLMKQMAFVFGGSKWERDYENNGRCQPSPTDMCILSQLMGHAGRYTTIENYCNSFFWLQRYWILRKEKICC